jgi:chitinase
VDDIINATVDSTATAVTNNMSVDLAYAVPAANVTTFQGGHHHSPALDSDAVMIGDFKQVALSDTSAVSVVTDVSLNKYKNLGGEFRPIVNSVATAVGNNLSISVKPVTGN